MKTDLRDPLLADVTSAQMLSGLSGAAVYLASRDGRKWFVRKAAMDPTAGVRLQKQAAKQRQWHSRIGELIRTPAILHEDAVGGRYYFDMEAVRGVDAVTFLRTADYEGITAFTDRLCEYVRVAHTDAPLHAVASADFFGPLYDRICEIHRSASAATADDLAVIALGLSRLRQVGVLHPTLCHGDMTLENLIVEENGDIWAFDMLDSPFEHYWHDVAKLHQDLEGAWYMRRQPPVARCITEYVSRRILAAVEVCDPRYRQLHTVLVACTFARILPYVRTPQTLAFVQGRITYFADRIRRNS